MAYDLLLALHFLGLFMGGAAGLGLPVLGAAIQATQVDHRPSVGKAARPLRLIGQSGVGLLIQPLFSGLLGYLWFAEILTMIDVTGMAMIFVAILLVRRPSSVEPRVEKRVPPTLGGARTPD